MLKNVWKEYELFCPVCNTTFKQLVVLHKVPDDFDIQPYLAGFIESHDHKAWQEAQKSRQPQAGEQKE